MEVVLIFYSTVGILVSILFIRALSEVVSLVVVIPDLYEQNMAPLVTSLFGNVEQSILNQDPALVATLENLLGQFVKSIGEIISDVSMGIAHSAAGTLFPGCWLAVALCDYYSDPKYYRTEDGWKTDWPASDPDIVQHVPGGSVVWCDGIRWGYSFFIVIFSMDYEDIFEKS